MQGLVTVVVFFVLINVAVYALAFVCALLKTLFTNIAESPENAELAQSRRDNLERWKWIAELERQRPVESPEQHKARREIEDRDRLAREKKESQALEERQKAGRAMVRAIFGDSKDGRPKS